MAKRKAFLLRMNPALWDELEKWAADEFRSVNGQIEFLLRRAVLDERKKDVRERGRDDVPPS
ncbi:MAG: Arc family DNA binding domain-containing protein [Gemmatimonadetes bacterium]|nr:Arc family DNA binding domain-containing protein [Gemmatimonadota bacterium]